MSSSPYQCKEDIRQQALSCGAVACGFAKADVVDTEARDIYSRWVAGGKYGGMQYCERYADVRDDARMLLDGAKTVISCAFNYHSSSTASNWPGKVSRYALGADYHHVVRERLTRLADYITDRYGGSTRVLVDTAPMRERYWAEKCGIGFVGVNNQLIVPGVGSYVFLGEVLWTGSVEPDTQSVSYCESCGRCVKACPGQALDGSGGCDARRCVSYLTIEHRGDLPEDADLDGWIYGCDVCQMVCPHNAGAPDTEISEFNTSSDIALLTIDEIAQMSASKYRRKAASSAMSRVTPQMIFRNLRHNRK